MLVVARRTRRLLLQLRQKKPQQWSFFGGRLEPRETPSQAAQREFAEETGYQKKLHLIPLHIRCTDDLTFYTYLAFVPEEFDVKPSPPHDEETADSRWVNWRELLALSPKHNGLQEVLATVGDRIHDLISVENS